MLCGLIIGMSPGSTSQPLASGRSATPAAMEWPTPRRASASDSTTRSRRAASVPASGTSRAVVTTTKGQPLAITWPSVVPSTVAAPKPCSSLCTGPPKRLPWPAASTTMVARCLMALRMDRGAGGRNWEVHLRPST